MTVQMKQLSNGITLICETTTDDLAYIGIGFNVGSRDEHDPRYYGIAHCVEHMMFKSSQNRTTQQIALEMDKLGASNNAYTSADQTVYYTDFHIDDFSQVVDIMFDTLLHPLFKDEEFSIEKNVIRQEILMNLGDPEYHIRRLNTSVMFADTSYEHPILGTWESVSKLTHDDLQKFYEDNYTSNRCVISFVGKMTMAQFEKAIRTYCKEMRKGSDYHEPKFIYHQKTKNFSLAGIEQNNITILYNSICQHDRNYRKVRAASRVLNNILAGGMSARLWKRIREELGLVYGIQATQINMGKVDMEVIGCKSNKDPKFVIKEINKVLEDLIKNGVTQEELNTAKRQFELTLMSRSKELNDLCLDRLSMFLSRGLQLDNERIRSLKAVQSVTEKDVISVAKKLLKDQGIIVVSPKAKKSFWSKLKNLFMKEKSNDQY